MIYTAYRFISKFNMRHFALRHTQTIISIIFFFNALKSSVIFELLIVLKLVFYSNNVTLFLLLSSCHHKHCNPVCIQDFLVSIICLNFVFQYISFRWCNEVNFFHHNPSKDFLSDVVS